MIEIQNIHAIQKGNLLAVCDVYIKPWKLTLKEIKVFQKGINRWIMLPSKEVVENNEKRYVELMVFDSEVVKNRFRSQITAAIDAYLIQNPEMKAEDVIKDEELPF